MVRGVPEVYGGAFFASFYKKIRTQLRARKTGKS